MSDFILGLSLKSIVEGFLGNVLFAIVSLSAILGFLFFKKKTRYNINVINTSLQGRFDLTDNGFLVVAKCYLYKSENDRNIDYSFKYFGFRKGNKYFLYWKDQNFEKINNGFTILDKVRNDTINGSNLFYDSQSKKIISQDFILNKYT